MPRPSRIAPILLVLAASAFACPAARAQKEILDNIILLGPAETLNLPGVDRVEERPEEKGPPEPYGRMLGGGTFHRPLSTRFGPHESYVLEEGPALRNPSQDMQLPQHEDDERASKFPGPAAPRPLPGSGAERYELAGSPIRTEDFDDPGPPDGMTVEAAIARLVHSNRDLRTKYHEIPQAQADILTAGLRGNPIVFFSAGGTPYGRWSNQPGVRDFPIVITYLLDFTGRRAARVQVARTAEKVLEARYQDEVRRKVATMDDVFVDLLAAREQARSARRALDEIERAKGESGGRRRSRALDRTLAAMALRDAEDRLSADRGDLAAILDIPAEEAGRIELHGALRDASPAPPREVLLQIATSCRADLVAQRLAVDRALALVRMEKSRSIRDTYILYEPWNYEVGQVNQVQRGVNAWGIALFAPLPLFDRNQGNIQRARLEVSKMQVSVTHLERQVADEVRASAGEFDRSLEDQREFEEEVIPQAGKEYDEAVRAYRAGRLDATGFRAARRDLDDVVRAYREVVVRHRRCLGRLNAAVGQRVVPCVSGGPPPSPAGPTMIRRASR